MAFTIWNSFIYVCFNSYFQIFFLFKYKDKNYAKKRHPSKFIRIFFFLLESRIITYFWKNKRFQYGTKYLNINRTIFIFKFRTIFLLDLLIIYFGFHANFSNLLRIVIIFLYFFLSFCKVNLLYKSILKKNVQVIFVIIATEKMENIFKLMQNQCNLKYFFNENISARVRQSFFIQFTR